MSESQKIYNKIKRQKGERFARALRDHHGGLFTMPELPDLVRYAGDDAEALLPCLTGILMKKNETGAEAIKPEDPFELLARAGYDAFYADTLEKQNSIRKYFTKNELLCTFNSVSRFQEYYIIHAVRKDAGNLARQDFNGIEKRQDACGTSVISIQVAKCGGHIKITNRYNHTVDDADHTFQSNPDNIIPGLSAAIRDHFNVEFEESDLPNGYALAGNHIVRHYREQENIFFGDGCYVERGTLHVIDKLAGDALISQFRYDHEAKELVAIDPRERDSFADNFNRYYADNDQLRMESGNLMLGDHVLIATEKSQITAIDLPAMTHVTDRCLLNPQKFLKTVILSNLKTMGEACIRSIGDMGVVDLRSLEIMGQFCLSNIKNLHLLDLSSLKLAKYGSLSSLGDVSQLVISETAELPPNMNKIRQIFLCTPRVPQPQTLTA